MRRQHAIRIEPIYEKVCLAGGLVCSVVRDARRYDENRTGTVFNQRGIFKRAAFPGTSARITSAVFFNFSCIAKITIGYKRAGASYHMVDLADCAMVATCYCAIGRSWPQWTAQHEN